MVFTTKYTKNANKTTANMVRKAKSGKGTLTFTPKKKGQKFAEGGSVLDDDPGILENIARYLHDGRDLARRRFYNETAGTNTGPEGMKIRRQLQGYDAKNISRAVRKDLREED